MSTITPQDLITPFLNAASQGAQLAANFYMMILSIGLFRKKPSLMTGFNLATMVAASIRSIGFVYYLVATDIPLDECVVRKWFGSIGTPFMVVFPWLVQYTRVFFLYAREKKILIPISILLFLCFPSVFLHFTNGHKVDKLGRCAAVLVPFWQLVALGADLFVVVMLSASFSYKIYSGYKESKSHGFSSANQLMNLMTADIRASFITSAATIAKMLFNVTRPPSTFLPIHITDWIKVYACFQFAYDVLNSKPEANSVNQTKSGGSTQSKTVASSYAETSSVTKG